MGRVRQAVLFATLAGWTAFGLAALLLWKYPNLARGAQEMAPRLWVVSACLDLLVILALAFPIFLSPRRFRPAVAAALGGALVALATLIVAFPPPFVGWSWLTPFPNRLVWVPNGRWDRAEDPIVEITLDSDCMSARTFKGIEWNYDLPGDRVLERRQAEPLDFWQVFLEDHSTTPRILPVEAINAGVPLHVFETNGNHTLFFEPPRSRKHPSQREEYDAGTVCRTRDGRRLLELRSFRYCRWGTKRPVPIRCEATTRCEISPSGNLALVSVPSHLAIFIPFGVRLNAFLPNRFGHHLHLYDLEKRKTLWRNAIAFSPYHYLRFSPSEKYAIAGGFLFEVSTGRKLGPVSDVDRAWSPDERFLVLRNGYTIELPQFRVIGQRKHGYCYQWHWSSDGKLAATAKNGEIRVCSLPDFELVRTFTLVTSGWLIDRCAAPAAATALLSGLVILFIPARRRVPRFAPVKTSGHAFGKTLAICYLLLLPVCVLSAAWLPLALPGLWAGILSVTLSAVLFPVALHSWQSNWSRAIVLTALAVLPLLCLLSRMRMSTEHLGESPSRSLDLVNDRWIVTSCKVLDIREGKEVARLNPGGQRNMAFRYELEGQILRGRRNQMVLDWSTKDWSLTRAEMLPLVSDTDLDAWMCGFRGCNVKGRIVPLVPLWGSLADTWMFEQKVLADGRVVFSCEEESGTHIYASSLAHVRYLEIPLHAALGALVLALLITTLRPRNRSGFSGQRRPWLL